TASRTPCHSWAASTGCSDHPSEPGEPVFAQPRGIQAYQQVQTESRSPLELVVMLYDGAIASLTQAHEAAARGDLRQRGAAVSKTLSIVGALREALDLTEG